MSDLHLAPEPAPQRYALHSIYETFLMKGVTLHYVPLDERGQPIAYVPRALIAYLTDQQMPGALPKDATDEQKAEHAKATADAKANQWYTKWHADSRKAADKAHEFLLARLGLTAA